MKRNEKGIVGKPSEYLSKEVSIGGFLMKIPHILLFMVIALGIVSGVETVSADEEPWRIYINIPQCRLYLYRERQLYQTYKIAVGKINTPSPVGKFRIANKVTNPVWYPGKGRKPVGSGPSNPLGRYWLGLSLKGYGIHGNNSSRSIGKPVSSGCFRMDNDEIKELFRLVPVGTPVEITYTTITADTGSRRGRIGGKVRIAKFIWNFFPISINGPTLMK